MNNEKVSALAYAFLFSFIAAIYFLITYVSTGSVSTTDKIIIFSKEEYCLFGLPAAINFSIAISSIWSVVLVFGLSWLFIKLAQDAKLKIPGQKIESKEKFSFWLGIKGGVMFGLSYGILASLILRGFFNLELSSALELSLSVGLGLVFILGLLSSGHYKNLTFEFWLSLTFGPCFGFGLAIIYGFWFGIVFAIALAIIFCLSFILGLKLGRLMPKIFGRSDIGEE